MYIIHVGLYYVCYFTYILIIDTDMHSPAVIHCQNRQRNSVRGIVGKTAFLNRTRIMKVKAREYVCMCTKARIMKVKARVCVNVYLDISYTVCSSECLHSLLSSCVLHTENRVCYAVEYASTYYVHV